nr:class Ib ribonucleoside-diphosphate reductase assembly flavoprotein NrdI [[Acholeplasma] multilocale]
MIENLNEFPIHVVYYSSISNNTHRFIQKLDLANSRIPCDIEEELMVNVPYILFTPTYGGGGDDYEGSVPKQVIKFLNNKNNRDFCCGVISSGNTNFGNTFAIAGPIISKKLSVPLLHQFELLGTEHDKKEIKRKIIEHWNQQGEKNEK